MNKSTKSLIMKKEKIPAIHPGEILYEEFIQPMGLTQNKLANAIKVPPRRINEIILGKRRITPDTALRLAKYFKMSPEFLLGLQMDYDLDLASDQLSVKIKAEVGEYETVS